MFAAGAAACALRRPQSTDSARRPRAQISIAPSHARTSVHAPAVRTYMSALRHLLQCLQQAAATNRHAQRAKAGQRRTSFSSRAFLAALSSGRYLSSSLKSVAARFLSTALVNRFSAGGTCDHTPPASTQVCYEEGPCTRPVARHARSTCMAATAVLAVPTQSCSRREIQQTSHDAQEQAQQRARTFSRWLSTRRCRCSRTYLGHFT